MERPESRIFTVRMRTKKHYSLRQHTGLYNGFHDMLPQSYWNMNYWAKNDKVAL